jgi:hypothetical protein
VQAAGYGGGSLVHANVAVRPPTKVFAAEWPAPYSRDIGSAVGSPRRHCVGVGSNAEGKVQALPFVRLRRAFGGEEPGANCTGARLDDDTFVLLLATAGGETRDCSRGVVGIIR